MRDATTDDPDVLSFKIALVDLANAIHCGLTSQACYPRPFSDNALIFFTVVHAQQDRIESLKADLDRSSPSQRHQKKIEEQLQQEQTELTGTLDDFKQLLLASIGQANKPECHYLKVDSALYKKASLLAQHIKQIDPNIPREHLRHYIDSLFNENTVISDDFRQSINQELSEICDHDMQDLKPERCQSMILHRLARAHGNIIKRHAFEVVTRKYDRRDLKTQQYALPGEDAQGLPPDLNPDDSATALYYLAKDDEGRSVVDHVAEINHQAYTHYCDTVDRAHHTNVQMRQTLQAFAHHFNNSVLPWYKKCYAFVMHNLYQALSAKSCGDNASTHALLNRIQQKNYIKNPSIFMYGWQKLKSHAIASFNRLVTLLKESEYRVSKKKRSLMINQETSTQQRLFYGCISVTDRDENIYRLSRTDSDTRGYNDNVRINDLVSQANKAYLQYKSHLPEQFDSQIVDLSVLKQINQYLPECLDAPEKIQQQREYFLQRYTATQALFLKIETRLQRDFGFCNDNVRKASLVNLFNAFENCKVDVIFNGTDSNTALNHLITGGKYCAPGEHEQAIGLQCLYKGSGLFNADPLKLARRSIKTQSIIASSSTTLPVPYSYPRTVKAQ